MKMIRTENITKKYKRYKKQEGVTGSIKGLFHREYEEKIAVVMGQKSQLFFELTAEDTLRLFKEIYRIPEDEYRKNKNFFVELFQVQELMDVQVRTLSLGERMKMELMVALLHNPKILFLDEPTIGLDAVASKQIRTFLKNINESRGTTILLTSHYMEDIKALCKRSIVVNHGRKIYDGDTDMLFEQYQKSRKMTIYFEHSVEPDVPEHCRILEKTNDKLVLEIPKQNTEKVLESYIGHYPIRDIGIEEEEIGSVVERIYKGV